MRPDPDQLEHDQLAAEHRLDRDAEREPARPLHRHPLCARPSPLAARRRWQASMQDRLNETWTMQLECPVPSCRGPVTAPRDSHQEIVVCPSCGADLITKRTIDGVDLAIHDKPEGQP